MNENPVPLPAAEPHPQRRGWRSSALLFTAVAVPLLLFSISAWQQWEAVKQDARIRVEHVRDVFQSHALRVFQTQQLLAGTVRDRIADLEPEALSSSPDIHEFLQDLKARFPEVRAIWIYGPDGIARASSLAFPVPVATAADRPFFQELRGGTADYAISMPYARGAGQEQLFSIGFRLAGRASVPFAGAIVIDIDPDYFQRIHEAVRLPDGVLSIVRSDGIVLARLPEGIAMPAQLPADSPLMRRAGANAQGTATAISSTDGSRRLFAFGWLTDFPVFVSYGIATAGLGWQWFERLGQQALYFGPATIILLLAAVTASRTQHQLAAVNRELAAVNASLEARIDQRTDDLTRALADKDVLIQEVHHRVKNNMQVINSLVGLQTRMGGSAEDTSRRIEAMALVHELIYGSGDLEGLDLPQYLRRLCDSLRSLLPRGVVMEFDLAPTRIPLEKAVPVALVLNETLTNILQRGFAEGEKGTVRLQLGAENGEAVVKISHSGSAAESTDRPGDLGPRLVAGLAAQLHGRIERSSGTEGTFFRLSFPIVRSDRQAA